MAQLGETAKNILTRPHDPAQRMLLQLLLNYTGDQDMMRVAGPTIVTVNQTGTLGYIEPPPDVTDSEWLIDGIWVNDTAGIDPADRVGMALLDTPANFRLWIFDEKGAQGETGIKQGTWWIWPSNISPPAGTALDVDVERLSSFIVFRQPTGESFRRIEIDYAMSATVASRSLNAYALVRKRPSTRI